MKNTFFILLTVLSATFVKAQTEEHGKNLLATWVTPSESDTIRPEPCEGVTFIKSDSLKPEAYGMIFHNDGILTRRSAKGFVEVTWYDHPGKWHFEGDTLVLHYTFDTWQSAEERVLITLLDDRYFCFNRQDWKEIRKPRD